VTTPPLLGDVTTKSLTPPLPDGVTTMAERVRCWRQSRRLSLSDLAALVGVSRQAVSSWERGVNCPTLDNIRRISIAVGISLQRFWGPPPGIAELRRQAA